jgi:hypothetical protein
MTPKEKAKELFDKYCWAIRTEETDSGYFTNILYAKQCALIAVDEILTADMFMMTEEQEKYWEQVKSEILSL